MEISLRMMHTPLQGHYDYLSCTELRNECTKYVQNFWLTFKGKTKMYSGENGANY